LTGGELGPLEDLVAVRRSCRSRRTGPSAYPWRRLVGHRRWLRPAPAAPTL